MGCGKALLWAAAIGVGGLVLLAMLAQALPDVERLSGSYTVVAGNTLSSIAVAHQTTVASLMDANGLTDPDLIEVGQRLAIRGSAARAAAPRPKPATRSPVEEPGAATEDLTQVQVEALVLRVRLAGYRCDSVSSAFPSLFSAAPKYRLTCNHNRYVYSIEDRGGRWTVELR